MLEVVKMQCKKLDAVIRSSRICMICSIIVATYSRILAIYWMFKHVHTVQLTEAPIFYCSNHQG